MKLSINVQNKQEFEQFPCIKCGYDGQLDCWQDRHYDTATLTCPQCKADYRGSISWSKDYPECVLKIWNPENDRNLHIENIQKQIDNLPSVKSKLQQTLSNLKKGKFFKEW